MMWGGGASCEIVRVLSPTVTVAVRALNPLFAESDNVIVVLPVPLVLDSETKPALDAACHEQLFGIMVTLRLAVCAFAVSARYTGARSTLQLDGSDDDGSVEDVQRETSTAHTIANATPDTLRQIDGRPA